MIISTNIIQINNIINNNNNNILFLLNNNIKNFIINKKSYIYINIKKKKNV